MLQRDAHCVELPIALPAGAPRSAILVPFYRSIIPLMRINSATASHSFSGMIHLASSRIIERVVIVEFAICLSLACSAGRRFVTECIHSCQWVKWLTEMVNATKKRGLRLKVCWDRY